MTSNTKVQYRQLGKSGLRVSVPIIGAMSFGSPEWAGAWVLGEEKAFEVLQAAWELGVNTIDTANVYSNGESERFIGNWIKMNNILRENIIIATKCQGLVGKTPGVQAFLNPGLADQREYVNQSGLSRAAIFNAVDASLKRLQLSYIDLLQIHRFDDKTPVEETMKALHDLVESGKVSLALLNEVASKNGWTKFISMQNEYSLLYREEEREMNAYCNFNGIGLIPWSPLAAGSLARPANTSTARSESVKGGPFEQRLSDADKTIISRVEELANKKGVKMGQIALAWVGSKVASPIVGVSSIQRLYEAITTDVELTDEEKRYLEDPYEPKPVRGHA